MMSTHWPVHTPFAREHHGHGLEEGEAKGIAEGMEEQVARCVLIVLAARGFRVSYDTRRRIFSCTDLDQLETWLTRAATMYALRELFRETG